MGHSILLVEDDPNDEEMIIRALDSMRLANPVVVARDGAEAINQLFDGHSPQPVLLKPVMVILDLKLPKVSGLEVLQRIRAHPAYKYLPVVVLTSSNEHRDILAAYDNGANSYIQKPVDAKLFQQAVTTIGLYWIMTNLPAPE